MFTTEKYDQFEEARIMLGLTSAWSIYQIDSLSDRHSFEGATEVVYEDHWGSQRVTKQINGLTWAALYVAADACIRDSGDNHHIFIESFERKGNTLFLHTGS